MKRLLPFVVLLVLLLGGTIAVPVLLNPERHRSEITDMLARLLKRPIVVGPLSMSYFPPVLQAGQVAVMKDGGTPFLQIDVVSAPLAWASLFRLKFVPTDLELTRWKLTLSRKADGSWDLGDWLSGFSGSSGSMGSFFRQVRWKDGEIHGVDPFTSPSQELVLESVDGSWDPKQGVIISSGALSGLGSPARLSFHAAGQFVSSPEWSGDLQLSDHSDSCAIHIEDRAGVWEIRGKAAQWPLANALTFLKFYSRAAAKNVVAAGAAPLTNWQFHGTASGPKLSFEHASGLSGGLSEVKGTLETSAAGTVIYAQGAAKDIPAGAIWGLLGEDIPLDGKVTGLFKDLQLALSTGTPHLSTGEGYAELKDGHYELPAQSIKKLSKAKTMPYIRKKFPDLEIKGLPVIRASSHWRVKEALVLVDDGFFESTSVKGSWSGKLDPARQGIDTYVRLDIHEKDPVLARLIPARYQSQPLFGRWLGTWQEWSLRSLRQAKIPSAVLSKLRKSINQK